MSNNILVGKTFNNFASLYSEVSNQYTIARRYQKAALFSKGKLLDIGGASGLFLSYLSTNIEPTVLDISYKMCIEAKRNKISKIVCADAENLPFEGNSFDSVVSLEMIYYLENPMSFIIEVERILKSNGIFVVSFYNSKLNFLVRLRGLLRKVKIGRMFIDDGNPTFTKLEALFQYIDNTSLEVIKIESVVFIPFKVFDKINKALERTFLRKYALFNIISMRKIIKN